MALPWSSVRHPGACTSAAFGEQQDTVWRVLNLEVGLSHMRLQVEMLYRSHVALQRLYDDMALKQQRVSQFLIQGHLLHSGQQPGGPPQVCSFASKVFGDVDVATYIMPFLDIDDLGCLEATAQLICDTIPMVFQRAVGKVSLLTGGAAEAGAILQPAGGLEASKAVNRTVTSIEEDIKRLREKLEAPLRRRAAGCPNANDQVPQHRTSTPPDIDFAGAREFLAALRTLSRAVKRAPDALVAVRCALGESAVGSPVSAARGGLRTVAGPEGSHSGDSTSRCVGSYGREAPEPDLPSGTLTDTTAASTPSSLSSRDTEKPLPTTGRRLPPDGALFESTSAAVRTPSTGAAGALEAGRLAPLRSGSPSIAGAEDAEAAAEHQRGLGRRRHRWRQRPDVARGEPQEPPARGEQGFMTSLNPSTGGTQPQPSGSSRRPGGVFSQRVVGAGREQPPEGRPLGGQQL